MGTVLQARHGPMRGGPRQAGRRAAPLEAAGGHGTARVALLPTRENTKSSRKSCPLKGLRGPSGGLSVGGGLLARLR